MKNSTLLLMSAVSVWATLQVACSPIRSAIVTGPGKTVLAVDMEAVSVLGAATLPDPASDAGKPKWTVVALQGTVVYLTGADGLIYILNIKDTGISLNSSGPLQLASAGQVMDTVATNPWILARTYGTTTSSVAVHNALSITNVASSVPLNSNRPGPVVVCDDGSTVLVLEYGEKQLRRFNLDRNGTLTDTGQVLTFDIAPLGVACAPNASAGAIMTPGTVTTFRITPTGLSIADSLEPYAYANSMVGPKENDIAFSADGAALFVRSSSILGNMQDGWLERFSVDPATADLGDTADFTVQAGVSYVTDRHQIGVDPQGTRVYLPNAFIAGGRIEIINAATGDNQGILTHPEVAKPIQFIVGR